MTVNKERPLSPHLTIYKPQISSVLSILHRISGFFLYIGLISLIWWVVYVTYVPDPLNNRVWEFFSSNWGMVILIAWSYSFFFHFCTGIRHLFWDMGMGYSLPAMNISGWVAFISSIILTSLSWYLIFLFGN